MDLAAGEGSPRTGLQRASTPSALNRCAYEDLLAAGAGYAEADAKLS
jgi:hypothetical protein